MRKVNFDQGSNEWLNWRRGLLTATDAATLLGVSPYCTPYKGWQRKIGDIPEQSMNAAMQRGIDDEPIARNLFIQEYGINMTPCCIESDSYNFIGSSLDGLSDCGEFILEVKSQRPIDKIPEFHMCQMQHQILSTDGKAKKAFYVSHWQGENRVFEVLPDLNWQKEYISKAKSFWEKVVFRDPPDFCEKDYQDRSNDASWAFWANECKNSCMQIKELEKNIKDLQKYKDLCKENLVTICNGESSFGSGIKLLKRHSKGRVDYEMALKDNQIDPEKYRKNSSSSWVIMLD